MLYNWYFFPFSLKHVIGKLAMYCVAERCKRLDMFMQTRLRIHQPFLSSRTDLNFSHVFRKPSYNLCMAREICKILQMLCLCSHTQFEPYTSMTFGDIRWWKLDDLSSSLFLNSRMICEYRTCSHWLDWVTSWPRASLSTFSKKTFFCMTQHIWRTIC